MNLLEKALQREVPYKDHSPTSEKLDLSLAWVNGGITTVQLTHALGLSRSSSVYKVATWLRVANSEGRIGIFKSDSHAD